MPPDDDPEIQDENLVMVVLLIWLPALFANEFWQNVFWTKKGGLYQPPLFYESADVSQCCVRHGLRSEPHRTSRWCQWQH